MTELSSSKLGRPDRTLEEPVVSPQSVNRGVQDPVNKVGIYEGMGSLNRSLAVFKAHGGKDADQEMVMVLINGLLESQVDTRGKGNRPLKDIDAEEISKALPKDKELVQDATGKYIIVDKK